MKPCARSCTHATWQYKVFTNLSSSRTILLAQIILQRPGHHQQELSHSYPRRKGWPPACPPPTPDHVTLLSYLPVLWEVQCETNGLVQPSHCTNEETETQREGAGRLKPDPIFHRWFKFVLLYQELANCDLWAKPSLLPVL